MDHDDHTLVEAELPPYLDMGFFLLDLIDKVYEAEVKVFAQVEATISKALGMVDEPKAKSPVRSKAKKEPLSEPTPLDKLTDQPRSQEASTQPVTGLLSHRADAMRYQRLLAVLQMYYTGTSIMFGMNPVTPTSARMPQPDSDDDLYEPPPLNPKKNTNLN